MSYTPLSNAFYLALAGFDSAMAAGGRPVTSTEDATYDRQALAAKRRVRARQIRGTHGRVEDCRSYGCQRHHIIRSGIYQAALRDSYRSNYGKP